MQSDRQRLNETREGTVHKILCGSVTLYVTVNTNEDKQPMEMFVKADEGWQGWADTLALTASMALQHGCPLETILTKWRGLRFSPDGMRAFSIPDAIARRLMPDEHID